MDSIIFVFRLVFVSSREREMDNDSFDRTITDDDIFEDLNAIRFSENMFRQVPAKIKRQNYLIADRKPV